MRGKGEQAGEGWGGQAARRAQNKKQKNCSFFILQPRAHVRSPRRCGAASACSPTCVRRSVKASCPGRFLAELNPSVSWKRKKMGEHTASLHEWPRPPSSLRESRRATTCSRLACVRSNPRRGPKATSASPDPIFRLSLARFFFCRPSLQPPPTAAFSPWRFSLTR